MIFRLNRCLTDDKIVFANHLIDNFSDSYGKNYILEIIMVNPMDSFIEGKTDFMWHVHFISVSKNGERYLKQEELYGTFLNVKNMFSNDLFINRD